MKKYLTVSAKGKWEIFDDLNDAKRVVDKKNKKQVKKWIVRELTEGKYECDIESRWLSFTLEDAPIVYNPCNIRM